MCDSKEEGGRRCKSSTPAYRREKRATSKTESLAQTAVPGVQGQSKGIIDPHEVHKAIGNDATLRYLSGAQAPKAPKASKADKAQVKVPAPRKPVGDTTATNAGAPEPRRIHAVHGNSKSRHDALVRYGDWMDYARVFEVSATGHNGTRLDLEAALHSHRPVGPWKVTETFCDHDGDLYALVELDPEWLTDEDNTVLFDDVGVESYQGIASLTVDGQSDVVFRDGAEDAFYDLLHAREATGLDPVAQRVLDEANSRADIWADNWERDAARKAEQASLAAKRIEGHQCKMQSARAVAADARKRLKAAVTVAELQAAYDNDDVADLSEKAQESLYDLYVARRREVTKASKVGA